MTLGYSQEQWGNAPDFTLPGLEEADFTLSSLKGRIIILSFWAAGCFYCQKEISDFIELYDKYKDKDLEIVGVCLEDRDKVRAFIEEKKINYTLVFANREVSRQYGGIRDLPTTFIIDRKGNIVQKHIGYIPKEAFEKEIKQLLGCPFLRLDFSR